MSEFIYTVLGAMFGLFVVVLAIIAAFWPLWLALAALKFLFW